jgi:hypothetical protein
MTYTFLCPAPCRRVIRVEARNDEDAVGKILEAGAMTCRNRESHDPCDATPFVMPPLTDNELKKLVRLIMQAEDLPETQSRD